MVDIDRALPASDFGTAKWRIRVDARCAIGGPLNAVTKDGFPSLYLQIAWTQYKQEEPSSLSLIQTGVVDDNRHPIWNEQLLYNNPPESDKPSGFLWIGLKDKYNPNLIMTVYIPIELLRPYQPIHLQLQKYLEAEKCTIFLSLTLELPITKLTETLCDAVIKWVDFDPIPKCTNRCLILMTTNGYKPNALPFALADIREEVSLTQAITSQNKYYAIFASPIIKIPPSKLNNEHSALTYFLFPRSLLNSKIAFYTAVQDDKDLEYHTLPANIVGYSDFINDDLKHIFTSEEHLPMIFPVGYTNTSSLYNEMASSKCTLEITCIPYGDKVEIKKSKYGDEIEDLKSGMGFERGIGKGAEDEDKKISSLLAKMESTGDKEKWQILSKELAQKQEIINRMMKEVDEKKQSLKLTGAEIIDLRRSVKLLQNENAILRRRLGEEEQIQLSQMVTKEISKMSGEELRTKILKLAQAYRAERLRNEEFDKALKGAHAEISVAKKNGN
eukprot:TRINITY_DN4251_c0_g1_i2.p1 TRINITY_DN4251_c0_g1~~TRINITY_DN4251_c0_g1_i2.p1  ORF type:complete len:500 (+),score=89.87 TRINITY_DN4251_c0_g1_i2:417-1916(+)